LWMLGQKRSVAGNLEFAWHPGFAKSQARKSIASLHEVAKHKGLAPVLEISSKSNEVLSISV
jgi:uncharacterized protein DUF6977